MQGKSKKSCQRIKSIESPLSQIAYSLIKFLDGEGYTDTTGVAIKHQSPQSEEPQKLEENKQYRNTTTTMKQKQSIKLNESQLRQIIKESIVNIVNEGKIVNNRPFFNRSDFDSKPYLEYRPGYVLDKDSMIPLDKLDKDKLSSITSKYKGTDMEYKPETWDIDDRNRWNDFWDDHETRARNATDIHNKRTENYYNPLGSDRKKFVYGSKKAKEYEEGFRNALKRIGMTYNEFIKLPKWEQDKMTMEWDAGRTPTRPKSLIDPWEEFERQAEMHAEMGDPGWYERNASAFYDSYYGDDDLNESVKRAIRKILH
jgi:hypothetical protein